MRFHKDNRILSASRLQVLSCQLSSQTKGACHWFFRYKVFTNDMVFVDGRFDRFETPWGYVKDGAGQFHAYIRDYQGSVVGVVNTAVSTRPLTQFTDYYPYGLPHGDATGASVNRRKFGGKEYLTESGLNELDFGARHMLPQYGLFTSPDPKAIDNTPFSPWSYCNGDPVNNTDPTGKQTVAVHGTWSDEGTWESQEDLMLFTILKFGNTKHDFDFNWSGGNYRHMRSEGAEKLINHVRESRATLSETEPLTLIGHSHGGNVIIEAVNRMVKLPEFADTGINIVTINTPVRPDYQLSEKALRRVTHINIYDPKDPVQVNGGNNIILFPDNPLPIKPFGEVGTAGRVFENAYNIEVHEPQGILGDSHNSHNRVSSWVYEALYNTHK